MTNVKKNNAESNVHLHNTYSEALSFVQQHLPKRYVARTQNILKEQGIVFSKGFIKNVKSGYAENEQILAVLAGIAELNKECKDKLTALVNS